MINELLIFVEDSLKMDFADGSFAKGRDSAVAGTKAYRSSLKNVISSVKVLTPLKPKGKDESWVCVGGKK